MIPLTLPRAAFIFLLILACATGNILCADNSDFRGCDETVKRWAAESLKELEGRTEKDRSQLQGLLFFLHVPRTGGRTYFHCFLRKIYTNDEECPRSYDKLRFDPSKPNCKLMVTHDDYSIMSKLPRQRTSVVTILRNPVDRVFSTYEFAVEVAARFLRQPNLASSARLKRRINQRSRGVSTLDIWPWKYLVPWMREDLFSRRDARHTRRVMMLKEAEDSYDLAALLMPLHEFIQQPLAHDIIHNGATFQIAGLTNNSGLEEAQQIRRCVAKYSTLGKYVLQVAKRRLDEMLYVGLTENHKESAAMFANVVGAQVLSQSQPLNNSFDSGSHAVHNRTGSNRSLLDAESEDSMQTHGSAESQKTNIVPLPENPKEETGNFTVAKLIESYEVCVSSLRKAQITRRISSLRAIAPANFSKEARSHVPERIIKEIQLLNSLDIELYKHAQTIFAKQQTTLSRQQKSVLHEPTIQERDGDLYRRTSWCSPWNILLAFLTVAPVIALISLVTSQGRTLKLKI